MDTKTRNLFLSPFLIFVFFIFSYSNCELKAQVLSKAKAFYVNDILARSPAGNKEAVSGLGLNLTSSIKYKVAVTYEVDNLNKDDERYNRVLIYKFSDSAMDCSTNECWEKLHLFSNKNPKDEFVINSLNKIMITGWSTNSSMSRGGGQDRIDKVEEINVQNKKGLKITFWAGILVTVTILPL